MSFSKNMSKNISNNVSRKYSQKFIHHAKQSVTGVLKNASKRAIQKTAKASGDIYIYIYIYVYIYIYIYIYINIYIYPEETQNTKLWMI